MPYPTKKLTRLVRGEMRKFHLSNEFLMNHARLFNKYCLVEFQEVVRFRSAVYLVGSFAISAAIMLQNIKFAL